MRDPHEVVKSLIRTEKGAKLLQQKKYQFIVDTASNKIEIRKAVEEIYKVKVGAVNTSMSRGKKRRVRYVQGKTPDWKKAIVTLKEGSKIDLI